MFFFLFSFDRCIRLRERLREIKCCTRKSRIAPAEPTVCCPPERRCGAICRRAFGCCKCNCKRKDTQQRTRNTRAKHSLTSVAPPPLSEVHVNIVCGNENYYYYILSRKTNCCASISLWAQFVWLCNINLRHHHYLCKKYLLEYHKSYNFIILII